MKRSIVLVGLAVAAAVTGLALWRPDDAKRLAASLPVVGPHLGGEVQTAKRQVQTPALPVITTSASKGPVPVTIDAIGTVQPVASVQIKSRIDGQIAAIEVREGSRVKEGDLLVRLDDRALKAQLAQAEAVVEKDRAQIEQARRDLGRAEELLGRRIGTEVARDNASTILKVQTAQLAADRASRDNLATLLSYTEIRAPISGRIGSIPLKVGTQVRNADAQPIATVNQVDPIFVSFAVPQSLFGELRSALSARTVGIEAKVGTATVPGVVSFVENTVDLATGTVLAKAEMANADERLWPGAFVAVQATLGIEPNAVSIPMAAVQIGQQGSYVFVVGADSRAVLTRVSVTRATGTTAVIGEGLAGGEQVVVDGQLRLVDGALVRVQKREGAEGLATGQAAPAAPTPRRG
jgi:multidrug efflux system membrane fusion protein